jgi:hypothetical protein
MKEFAKILFMIGFVGCDLLLLVFTIAYLDFAIAPVALVLGVMTRIVWERIS